VKIALTHVDLPSETKGGVAHQVHHFANVLAGRGHDVTLFTFSTPGKDCQYGVRQIPVSRRLPRRLWPFAFAWQLAQIDFSGFDVLHVNGDGYLLGPRGRGGARRPPRLRTFYGSARDEALSAVRFRRRAVQFVLAWLETMDARRADSNVGISEATRARIPAVSVIVPCGVDLSRFRPGPKTDHPTVLFVGTAGGRKRGNFLADVFAREIRPQFPDAELWTVSDQPLAGDNVVNLGRVTDDALADLYRRAWALCLPSTYEGFGVPYIEALASGTVAVASPNAGAGEVLQNGAWGVIAADDALGQQINTLLADSERRAHYEQRGLARAQEFDWASVAARYENIYRRLAGETSGGAMEPSQPVPPLVSLTRTRQQER